MKTRLFFFVVSILSGVMLTGQSFQFMMPNSQFVLIPGCSFESKAWIEVAPGDSVVLTASAGPELKALFQPHVVYQNQFVYVVVVSVDSFLSQSQYLTLTARQNNDSLQKVIHIANANDGHGFYLIDSARYYVDTAFGYLKHSFPTQKIFLNNLQHSSWIPSFPYPPLWIVTHHLFVYDEWRIQVLWHNMIPPDNWERVFIYNETCDSCYGININTLGEFSIIPCEIIHYNFQDTLTSIPEDPTIAGFQLWPNPATDQLHIRLDHTGSEAKYLEISSLTGQILFRTELVDHETLLNVSNLQPGMYLITLRANAAVSTKRFIKVR